MKVSRLLSGVTLVIITALLLTNAWSQDYPARPIRMVVFYAIGSSSDLHSRVVAQRLGEQIGQPILVENNGGASGIMAMRSVYRAQPAGYTLLFSTNPLVGNLYAFKDPQYRLEDYALVGTAGTTTYALMVNTNVPGKTIQEFVAYARANPGKLNYGSSGPTSGTNILSERLKAAAGIDMVMVPFKGGEPATAALLAGDIHIYFSTVGAVRTRLKSPQIKALAVSDEQRAGILPDLPTFKEAGYPSVSLGVWFAIFAPAATPAPAMQKLRDAMARANATPEMKKQLERVEMEAWTGNLEQFMTYIKAEGAAIREDYRKLKIPLLD